MGSKFFCEEMLTNYETMFGDKPKDYSSHMEEKDHPDLDDTPELGTVGIKQYQHWCTTLDRTFWLLSVY